MSTCPGCNCGGTGSTYCDFIRSGGLNGYYIEIGISPGTLTNDGCEQCAGSAGTWMLCGPEGFSGSSELGTQTYWSRTGCQLVEICPLEGTGHYGWMQALGSVSCLNGNVTVSVTLYTAVTPSSTPGDCGEVISATPIATFRLMMTEAEFETFLSDINLYEFALPWHDTSVANIDCEVNEGALVYFRLRDTCAPTTTTTTTTTPAPWWCLSNGADPDCLTPECTQLTLAEVEACAFDETCYVCDDPFASLAECQATGYCQTTTTTTTTTPYPYYCCGEEAGDCYGTVACTQGPPCESRTPALPNCGGPYGNDVCDSMCVSLTTTTCSGDKFNMCENSCYMFCESGSYGAVTQLFDPLDCECDPSPSDLALVGQPCTDIHLVPMCNVCPDSEYACTTTTTPAP